MVLRLVYSALVRPETPAPASDRKRTSATLDLDWLVNESDGDMGVRSNFGVGLIQSAADANGTDYHCAMDDGVRLWPHEQPSAMRAAERQRRVLARLGRIGRAHEGVLLVKQVWRTHKFRTLHSRFNEWSSLVVWTHWGDNPKHHGDVCRLVSRVPRGHDERLTERAKEAYSEALAAYLSVREGA